MEKIAFAFLVARGKTLDRYLNSPSMKSTVAVGMIVDHNDYIIFPWEQFDASSGPD
jgi:hypothetical protein